MIGRINGAFSMDGRDMKVGDLVRARDGDAGIVLAVEYVKAGQYWITCLWPDGEIESLGSSDIVVINESR